MHGHSSQFQHLFMQINSVVPVLAESKHSQSHIVLGLSECLSVWALCWRIHSVLLQPPQHCSETLQGGDGRRCIAKPSGKLWKLKEWNMFCVLLKQRADTELFGVKLHTHLKTFIDFWKEAECLHLIAISQQFLVSTTASKTYHQS